jgi:ADP-heptose:LPS heptosyltransferase
VHEVDRNLSLISSFCDKLVNKPCLYPSEKDYKMVDRYKKETYVCIAPTSVWFTKQYPSEKWIELINSLVKSYHVYLLGGKDDWDANELILCETEAGRVHNFAGKLTFLESAALMKNAFMNYVNDSAPQHIASAMDAPVSAVFCSTIPKFGFGPLSENSTVIETKENLDCRPCGLHGKKACPEGHFKCATTIELHQMLFQ